MSKSRQGTKRNAASATITVRLITINIVVAALVIFFFCAGYVTHSTPNREKHINMSNLLPMDINISNL